MDIETATDIDAAIAGDSMIDDRLRAALAANVPAGVSALPPGNRAKFDGPGDDDDDDDDDDDRPGGDVGNIDPDDDEGYDDEEDDDEEPLRVRAPSAC